jgi:SAM-dependent methyltransferase
MSGATVAEFIGYWEAEGQTYVRRGDYDWMAAQVPGQRILEIGCGVGFATQAIAARGLNVLAVDSLAECLAASAARVSGEAVVFLEAEVTALTPEQRVRIESFSADTVVCWLMGAPAETTGATATDGGRGVVAYREKIHRAVAELAVSLPTVKFVHFVDRTAIPWQAKDIGRDTLVSYHAGKTLLDLPLTAERRNALYRKLDDQIAGMAKIRNTNPALKGVVPTLASLLAERKK